MKLLYYRKDDQNDFKVFPGSEREFIEKDYLEKIWITNGKLHRDDGPAVIHANGSESWYQNGEKHREDEPAVIHADGSEFWYLHGMPWRKNGPASVLILSDKALVCSSYFVNGSEIDIHSFFPIKPKPLFVENYNKK